MEIKISLTNTKLGGFIPSINIPAGLTCRKDAPCQKICYAKKYHWTIEKVKASLKNNLLAYLENSDEYFNQIISFLNNEDVIYKYFRWHSSGDIVDYRYLKGIIRVAESCPLTKFLCFTKKFDLVNYYLALGYKIPSNLNIVFSGWDSDFKDDNPYNLPTTTLKFTSKAKRAKFKRMQSNATDLVSLARKKTVSKYISINIKKIRGRKPSIFLSLHTVLISSETP